ncbi:MAG: reductive dehalogenase [Candidatus Thermoplasmatota archaeon]
MEKEVESPTYTIDEDRYSRFDKRDTVFGRKILDPHVDFYDTDMYEKVDKVMDENNEGYSPVQFAQMMGAWTVYDYFHGAFSWEKLGDANNVMSKPILQDFKVEDRVEMSEAIKETAKIYGASMVGITELNKDWLYSHDYEGEEIDIPDEFGYAIVMAIKLDPQRVKKSPSFPAGIESGLGYSKMAFTIGCLAEFIRSLGYRAIPMGNDTALSIPLAIDAGLGELGRNGLLITPEYGPSIKLCKVFTDMPLHTDNPISFGVEEFCKDCGKCAEACEADAIRAKKEPSFETINRSNNEGIKRWAVDHEKCYKFWIENGSDCSTCVKVCPFVDMAV